MNNNYIETKLQSIANILLLQSSNNPNLGLFGGQTGAAIFFYEYARLCGNNFYENTADTLIDLIYAKINNSINHSFFTGLAGIGWGMEFLVKQRYVEADTDDILEDTDKILFPKESNSFFSFAGKSDIAGKAIYFLSRIKNTSSTEKKNTHLTEFATSALNEIKNYSINSEKLDLSQLNSILFFLLEISKRKLTSVNISEIIANLEDTFIQKAVKSNSLTDQIIFDLFSAELDKITGNSKISNLKSFYIKATNIENEEDEFLNNTDDMIKAGWYSKFYGVDFSQNTEFLNIIKKALLAYRNADNWYSISIDKKKDLAGLAFCLMNYKSAGNGKA